VTIDLFVVFAALCGLKQSPSVWFNCFIFIMLQFGFTHYETYHFVFSFYSPPGLCIYFVVYVDDIVINSNYSYGI